MKPAEKTRVWRKTGRDKGVPKGRRRSHRVRTEQPRPRSTRARQPLPQWEMSS